MIDPVRIAVVKPGELVRRPFDQLRSAVAVLTRLPLGGAAVVGSSVPAFPIVGAVLGLTTSLPLVALGSVTPVVSAILGGESGCLC